MNFDRSTGILILMVIVLMVSGCRRSRETTFQLPATPTSLPSTAVAKPTVETISESADDDHGTTSHRLCLVMEEGITKANNYWNDIHRGVRAITSDYGVEVIYMEEVEPESPEGIEGCINQGATIVILANNVVWGEMVLSLAEAHPEVYFVGIDHVVQDGPSNYAGLLFREDEVGFLVGYLAGLVTESRVVAGVYGPELAVLRRFRHGFEGGVRLAAEERDEAIEVLGVYLDSFEEPERGAEAAQTFIEAGADVIFGAAGTSGNGAILHAAQRGVYVIGVDQDQYFTVFEGGDIKGADKIISSALKRVNVGVFELLSILLEGNLAQFPGGSNYVLNVTNGGGSFANPHEADVPAEFYDQVAKLEQELLEGKRSTGVDMDPASGHLLSDTESAEIGKVDKVCLVAHGELVNDGGFFQYAYEGMQFVVDEQGIEGVYLEPFDNEIVETFNDPRTMTLIQQCLNTGAEVVITTGFTSGEATLMAAEANPNIFFIGVDHFVENGPPNYAGIQAREDEVGFLVGYLAGWATESNMVAGVYGPPDPPIKRFRNGYEQGVRLAAERRSTELDILGIYLDSYEAPDAGAEAAQTFIDAGADVIFGAAGRSGSGAILHAAAQGSYVIGVDQDEYFTTFQGGDVAGADRLISSALKRVDNGVISLLKALVKGDEQNFPGGSNYILTVANGGLTFANPHEANISDEIYDQVADVEQALTREELVTGVDPVSGELLR